jgi:hypothetical protein
LTGNCGALLLRAFIKKNSIGLQKRSRGSQELTQRRLTYVEEKTNPQRRGKEQQEKITKNLTNS